MRIYVFIYKHIIYVQLLIFQEATIDDDDFEVDEEEEYEG